jgi:hypothetical protein
MTRVGAAEKATIEQLGVRVIDASAAGWGIVNHDLVLSNTDVQRVIRRAIADVARLARSRRGIRSRRLAQHRTHPSRRAGQHSLPQASFST